MTLLTEKEGNVMNQSNFGSAEITLSSEPVDDIEKHTTCKIVAFGLSLGLYFEKRISPMVNLYTHRIFVYSVHDKKPIEYSSITEGMYIDPINGDKKLYLQIGAYDYEGPILIVPTPILTLRPCHQVSIYPIASIPILGENQMEEIVSLFEKIWHPNMDSDSPIAKDIIEIVSGKYEIGEERPVFPPARKNRKEINRYANTAFIDAKKSRGTIPNNRTTKGRIKK